MSDLREILFVLKDLLTATRTTPEVHLGYNAADDLVEIRKVIDDVPMKRGIDDPDVTDTTVDKWVQYKEWKEVKIE